MPDTPVRHVDASELSAGVQLRGVTKHYGQFPAVKGINLTFKDGELTVILGPSGCGKTTTLRLIAGLEDLTAGTIWIGGEQVAQGQQSLGPEGRGVGIVFQSYALWPHMTVWQNVAFPLRMKRTPRPEQERIVGAMLELVGLPEYARRFPTQLSGGQQQRVALARALVGSPTTLLLDEPLANLDAKLRESMRKEIRRVQRETKTTAIYVTHDQTEALSLADHIVIMDLGVVVAEGRPRDLYQRPPNLFSARFLSELNEFEASVVAKHGDSAVIELGALKVKCIAPGVSVGERVVAAIRHSDLHVQPGAPHSQLHGDSKTVFSGSLSDSAFLGTHQQVTVNAQLGTVRGHADPQVVFDPGEDVAVSFSQKDILVYPFKSTMPSDLRGPSSVDGRRLSPEAT